VQVIQMLIDKEKPLDSEHMKTDKDHRWNDNLLYSSVTSESEDILTDIYPERKGVNKFDNISHYCNDANAILYPYEFTGTCADSSCPYQHLIAIFSTKHLCRKYIKTQPNCRPSWVEVISNRWRQRCYYWQFINKDKLRNSTKSMFLSWIQMVIKLMIKQIFAK